MRNIVLAIMITSLVSVPGMAEPSRNSWDNLRKLKAGQTIEVVDVKLRKLRGKFVSLTDEEVSLRVKKDIVILPKSDVTRVGLRRSRSRRAFIGMLIGLGIGGGLTPIGWKAGEEAGSNALALIPVGLAVGAGIGAALPPSYQTVYQVKQLTIGKPGGRGQK